MVYIETPDKKSSEADNSIIKGYNLIKERFNKKQIKLLYFFNDEIRGEPCSLSSDIKKIILNYKDKNPDNPSYSVDFNALIKELSMYSLKRPFYKKAAIFITRVFINLIPTKNLRRKLKNKFHIK